MGQGRGLFGSFKLACTRVKTWWGPSWESVFTRGIHEMLVVDKGLDGFTDSPIVKTLTAAWWGSCVLWVLAVCVWMALSVHSRSNGGALAVPCSFALYSLVVSSFSAYAAMHAKEKIFDLFMKVPPRIFWVPQLTPAEVKALLITGRMLRKVSCRVRWSAWAMRGLLLGRLLLCGALMSLPVFTGGLFVWVLAAGGFEASIIVLLMARQPQPEPGPVPELVPGPT